MPDLNSVPPSPRPLPSSQSSTIASSRRVSQVMAPPPVPGQLTAPSSGGREAISASSSLAMNNTAGSNSGVAIGPGPLRHPRPLTAVELHLQLEKEQEAVVNRLTRELVLLRQQTASVASTASSTSTGLPEVIEHGSHASTGPIHPTASRRHRSSSNLSAQSANLTGINVSAVTGIAPARDIAATPFSQGRGQPSRRDSLNSSRRSEASSPSIASSFVQSDHFPMVMASRHTSAHLPGPNAPTSPPVQPTGPSSARSPPSTTSASSNRFEEVAFQRAELEVVRRENESLRQRVQELERRLNEGNRHASSDTKAE